MPIDSMILDPMLDTFRNMYSECEQQGLSGKDFDDMKSLLDRMEQLGQEHSDITAFNGQMMQENLFAKFSDSYGKVLSAQQSGSGSTDDYDDAAMLKSSVDALKQSVAHLKQSYQDAIDGSKDNNVEVAVLNDPSDLIEPIETLIRLGEEPGMTLPDFLRIQIEKGLDKAMEGAVAARKAYERALEWESVSAVSKFHIEREEEKIKVFDDLSSKQQFNVPNWKELSFAIEDVNRLYEPKIIKWNTIKEAWEALLWDLSFWSLSYCSFAPYIEPWSMSKDPKKAVKKTQDITPGLFKERLRLFEKYFGMSFMDIFKHETFAWEVKYGSLDYSQEYTLFLIEKVFPACKPLEHLNSDIISEREAFSKPEDRTGNPESDMPGKRQQQHYDAQFGAGRFASKYGNIEPSLSKAAAWDWSTFEYKN